MGSDIEEFTFDYEAAKSGNPITPIREYDEFVTWSKHKIKKSIIEDQWQYLSHSFFQLFENQFRVNFNLKKVEFNDDKTRVIGTVHITIQSIAQLFTFDMVLFCNAGMLASQIYLNNAPILFRKVLQTTIYLQYLSKIDAMIDFQGIPNIKIVHVVSDEGNSEQSVIIQNIFKNIVRYDNEGIWSRHLNDWTSQFMNWINNQYVDEYKARIYKFGRKILLRNLRPIVSACKLSREDIHNIIDEFYIQDVMKS
jgi:hypothetical protein